MVREIAFSPDSTKLAVSQSDNIVFVYNLGSKWGDKKTICNKFEQNTQVTTMIWPLNKSNELYFGVAEGKIKAGILKSNYAQILYSTETYVVSLCSSQCGKFLLSGHIDQTIWKYSLESGTTNKIITYSSIPYCLSCTYSILIAGNDSKVSFYSDTGEHLQFFDYSNDISVKDFTISRSNNSGDLIAVGNFDKFFIFMFNNKKSVWEEALIKHIPNYFTITAMSWRPDMSSLVTGSLCGSLDIFESCLKKSLYGDKFELIYLSHSQIMIKNLENNKRIVLKSLTNSEIIKINIFHNQYILLATKDSLIFGDINENNIFNQSAEINWNYTGNEKFDFSNSNVCMMHTVGEIIIIEYGINEIIGYCRTEYTHSNLISARVNYLKNPLTRRFNSTTGNNFSGGAITTINYQTNLNNNTNNIFTNVFNSPINTAQNYFNNSKINYYTPNTNTNFFNNNGHLSNGSNTNGFGLGNKINLPSVKIIAYLVDLQTIHIQDLQTQNILNRIYHSCNIEFLDLNKNSTKIIFRDSKRCLYIYYIEESRREILLNFCGFVQWVPNTDVLVAQDQTNLYVWYHIDDFENYKILPIKGDVQEVKRVSGKTEVLVEEFGEAQIYLLDENLICLFQAIENYDITNAINIIENINFENKSVGDVYWKSLARKALEEFAVSKEKKFIFIAQRCYAAVGSYARVKYLKDLAKKILLSEEDVNNPNFANEIIIIQAKLFMLDKQFVNAENLLCSNNLEREAINLLNSYNKYEDSLRIAERFNFPEARDIKHKYLQYLIENKIYDKAGLLYEKDGNFESAIKMYMEGNSFINAVNLIIKEKNNLNIKIFSKEKIDKKLVDFLSRSLVNSGLFEKAGEFISEITDEVNSAVDLFIRGNCYEKALNLAKKNLLIFNKTAKGNIISKIEENWGDNLFNQGLYDQAIHHFSEAEKIEKVISCYINNKKWTKAIELMDKLEDEKLSKEFNLKIAENFKKEKNLLQAEKYYDKANETEKILELYIELRAWDKLENLLTKFNYKNQLISHGMRLESQGKFKDAEKVYLYANEADFAIKMYKDAKFYDEMILLVKRYLPHLIEKTYDMLGNTCEKEMNYKKAEDYYSKTNNPIKAVEMYFGNNLVEEGIKLLSKIYFKNFDVLEKIIIDFQKNFGFKLDDLIKIILKLNYFELAIRLECFQLNFDTAISIAETHAKEHLPVVYFSIAEELKMSKNYFKAEEFYRKAKKFTNSIKMYEEINDFNSALRIARKYNEKYVVVLYEKEGFFRLNLKEFDNAEICFNKAGRPEIMFQTYLNMKMVQKANDFAKKYCPELLANSNIIGKKSFLNLEDNSEDNTKTPLSKTDNLITLAEKYEADGEVREAIETYFEAANNFDVNQKKNIIYVLIKIENILKICFDNNLTAVGNKTNTNFFNKISENEKNNYLELIIQKYLFLQEYGKAGELLKNSNQLSRALNSFMKGNLDKESQDLIEFTTGQLKEQLISIYSGKKENLIKNENLKINKNETKYNSTLSSNEDNIEEEKFIEEVNSLFEKGKYEEILLVFKNRNKESEIFTKTFIQIANVYFNNKDFLQYSFLLNKTDINFTKKTIFVLKNLSMEILAEENLDEIENLKSLMDKRFKNFNDPSVVNSPEESSELIRLQKISHFQNIKLNLSNYISKFKNLFYVLNLSLLQYGDVLSMDKIILEIIKISKHSVKTLFLLYLIQQKIFCKKIYFNMIYRILLVLHIFYRINTWI